MDAEKKSLLASYAKRKRERTVLLKDLHPIDLLILCDLADERGLILPLDFQIDTIAYLSRATPDQTTALASRLPHAEATIPGYPRVRHVIVFAERHLWAVLDDHLSDARKYIKEPKTCSVGVGHLFLLRFSQAST